MGDPDTQQEGIPTVKDLSRLFTNNLTEQARSKTKDIPDSPLQVDDVSDIYAVVNKPHTKMDQDSIYSNSGAINQRGPAQSSQSDQCVYAPVPASPKPPPPVKPPRTFAHDAYLLRKGSSKPKPKLTSLSEAPENPCDDTKSSPMVKRMTRPTASPYEAIPEIREPKPKVAPQYHRRQANAYEEIEDCRTELREVPLVSEYEDIAACRPGKQLGEHDIKRGSNLYRRRPVSAKRPLSRPPPPPRPPLPSLTAPPGDQDENNPVETLESDEIFVNPMYVERPDNTQTKTVIGSDGKLKRYKSDEYLYGKPPEVHPYYNDPVDCVRTQKPMITEHGVVLDTCDDSDNEVDIEQHRHRITHVSNTREKYGTLPRRESGVSQLFDYALIVSLGLNPDLNQNETRVLFHFPLQAADDVKHISEFCFPDVSTWKPTPYGESETYSFVLTNETGQRQYGHCRRIVPTGQSQPEVLCVVSPVQMSSFYDQLLKAVEKKRENSLDHAKDLLQSAYGRPMPLPGDEAWIRAPAAGTKRDTLVLRRSRDSKCDDVPFDLLLSKLSLEDLLKVFGSILLERRIIFLARTLSTLTGCVHALVSLMYPFEWAYTFIPVLPPSMIEICCAPTPFIVGVLSEMQSKLRLLPMEQVLIVDLDASVIVQNIGDEGGIIPRKLQKALVAAIKDESDGMGAFGMCADSPVPVANKTTIVFEAFLRMFVETIGHYTEYIVTQQDGRRVFEKEWFVKAVSSKSIRMFLEWFTQTQHFEEFINLRMEDDHSQSVFETRVYEYRVEMEEMPTSHNPKSVGKKMINFIVESGTLIPNTTLTFTWATVLFLSLCQFISSKLHSLLASPTFVHLSFHDSV
ncbi:hypothetical protein NP493_205g00004 [Ridgeia piscesae]|uniref:UDENN domain-containing protein n=1 Tax=Ridgeia piscesae TaxID=27915 RepID=A0AAD9P188_RIDPI|nr:hypothetical protein NP493_205g00004 [Ridgeia piscesae]